MSDHLEHVNRPMTAEERRLAEQVRQAAERDFPPKPGAEANVPPGIPRRIRETRQRLGLTRYELGRSADVPATVIRSIEQGEDVPLSQFRAAVTALGLSIELVEHV